MKQIAQHSKPKGRNLASNNRSRSKQVMPITDPIKKQIAQRRRLFFKICFRCGGRNPISASRCRKCHGHHLRMKNRSLGAKK